MILYLNNKSNIPININVLELTSNETQYARVSQVNYQNNPSITNIKMWLGQLLHMRFLLFLLITHLIMNSNIMVSDSWVVE